MLGSRPGVWWVYSSEYPRGKVYREVFSSEQSVRKISETVLVKMYISLGVNKIYCVCNLSQTFTLHHAPLVVGGVQSP
jgi:hypothetical protein